MRVLVVGSGGREHALVWKIARSPRIEQVFAAPGSDAMRRQARCHPSIPAGDPDGILSLARREGIDLIVIGPEDPLADGLADRLREAGFAVFGPSRAAAQLEASKSWAREFMARHGVPQPGFERFESQAAARAHVRRRGGACVVKADGLCAGKGVFVCGDVEAAERALDEIMGARRFGEAGAAVLIEDRLQGEEASYYAITDGERVVTLAAAQDHKRALDGDRGENTGGMGAYVPAPIVSEAVEKRILEEIVHPTLRGLRAEDRPYRGVLFCGLMIDASGAPSVIEFNVRFGDPETQALLVQLESDLLPLLDGAARGDLDPETHLVSRGAAVCVVLASGGYPRSYEKGKPISGLEEAEALEQVVVFHAGTRLGPDGGFVTDGGRVLGVTAAAPDVATARERAYAAAECIRFEGMQLRRDIGARALQRAGRTAGS
jgi:phosphoribosylamine--glycine ligase